MMCLQQVISKICGSQDPQKTNAAPQTDASNSEEPDLIIDAIGKHTHTVILLHGLYCRGTDYESVPQKMTELFGDAFSPKNGIKYIFPNAPVLTISWPEGEEKGVPSWYNYFTCKDGQEEDDEIDLKHFDEHTKMIHRMIDVEVQELGSASKVLLGGCSQGGTIAVNAALTYKDTLGALFLLRSIVLSYTEVPESRNDLPVYIFNAELDSIYVPTFTARRFKQFDDKGYTVTKWIEKGLKHWDDSVCELLYCAKWIGKVFFGEDVEVTTVDCPNNKTDANDEADLIIDAVGEHTHTVILLHGLYCRGTDFKSIPQKMTELFGEEFSAKDGIKYIFPNAPVLTISWPDGAEDGVPSWYNYFTCKDGQEEDDVIDMNHFQESTNRIHMLIDAEVNELGDASKVIVGGNSQGGTIACNVALTYKDRLGALFILRSNLLSYSEVPEVKNSLPIYIFKAELDGIYIPKLTASRFKQFVESGYTVTTWTEKDLTHEEDSESELWYCAKWIGSTFFGVDAEVTYVDRPDGPSTD